jgi:hypothetical protein
LLNTARFKLQLGARRHERVGVENAILLGALDLLTLVDQKRLVGWVADKHFAQAASLVDLCHGRAKLQGVRQATILSERLAAK